ncbi:nucleoside deaminase [Oscillospiraceae bacterium MB08-C2-2]|nr:nucleoside deaminase [Oscillospiraceae bacterium MB08-C2-2]
MFDPKATPNHRFMTLALEQAKRALSLGEIPVGAVIVQNGEVIATGYNRRETDQSAVAHAELLAIQTACEKLGSWRLRNCRLYVTLEPCPMCAGAILNAQLERVIFGAYNLQTGCMGSLVNLAELPFNHRPEVYGGVLEEPCQQLMDTFFAQLRK